MRALGTPPDVVVDPVTRAPRVGSFRGPLPRVDLGPLGKSPLFRVTHHKRWVYVAISTDEVFAAVAIAHLGYLANAFAFVLDRARGEVVVDRSAIGPAFAGSVEHGDGGALDASFRLPGTRARLLRFDGGLRSQLDVEMKGLEIHARLDGASAPPPIAVIAPVGQGVVNATEKRALLAASGELVAKGTRFSLDGGSGGYAYTHGYLARHPQWRWSVAMGRARTGERVAWNLVEGFVGELECAVWVDGELYPVGEGRFTFSRERPLDPWLVRTTDGALDLRFTPAGVHREHKDFGVLRSLFIQPVGTYAGTLEVGGRRLELDGVAGVSEDQEMLW